MKMSANELKEEGNAHFKAQNIDAALACYTKALSLCNAVNEEAKDLRKDKGVILKNRAACHLKLEKYEATVEDTTKCLEFLPNDSKALFRRCQAFERLGKLEDSFKDARQLSRLEPKNTAVQDILRRLGAALQAKSEKCTTTDGLVEEMFKSLFGSSDTDETKQKAIKNLTILANEEAGAHRIFSGGGVPQIISLFNGATLEQTASILKIFRGLCSKSQPRAVAILQEVTIKRLSSFIQSPSSEVSCAAVLVIQHALDALIPDDKKDRQKRRKEDIPQPEPEHKDVVRTCIQAVIQALRSDVMCAEGRDVLIDAVIQVVPKNDVVVELFLSLGGIKQLLEVAACTGPMHSEDSKPLLHSENTRMHISVAISKIYETYRGNEKKQEPFKKEADTTISKYLVKNTIAANIEGFTALCALIQGSSDAAYGVLTKEGVLPHLVQLAEFELPSQLTAAETIALASADKNLAGVIKRECLSALKDLYKLPNDRVRVRALVLVDQLGDSSPEDCCWFCLMFRQPVWKSSSESSSSDSEGDFLTGLCQTIYQGLCKLASVSSGSVNEDSGFSEDSCQKLYTTVRRYLVKPKKEKELRKWASEGLSFITMDAEVKETLVEDKEAMKALIELAKSQDSSLLYGVCQTLVNLTNTYDTPDIPEEMKKLGEFAKVNLPKLHDKDNEEFKKKRIAGLVKDGVISALVSLSSTQSTNSREMIARVFSGIASEQEHRGLTVQQGGAKVLLGLAAENSDVGKDLAAHALAKIAISMNPQVAFPGQKAFGLVRPLLSLLGPNKTGLQQFESLMALTNLAQMNDEVRRYIVREDGIPSIEILMFDEHYMIKRAATEVMCNMILCEEVFKLFEKDSPTERVKLFTLLAGEEENDFELARAAAGGLAMLSSSDIVCKKIMEAMFQKTGSRTNKTTEVKSSLDVIKEILMSEKTELKHRGAHLVTNMINSSKEIAAKLIETEILEILLVFSKDSNPEMARVRECAELALEKAVEYELIKPNQ